MDHYGWLIAGAAAASGFLGMFWGYVKGFWTQLASRVIVNIELRGDLMDPVSTYLWRNYRTSTFGRRTYVGWLTFIRPMKRVQLAAMEVIGNTGRLFWKGCRPIWMVQLAGKDNESIRVGGDWVAGGYKLIFIRGMFDVDKLIIEAVGEFNRMKMDCGGEANSRYKITHVFGTDGKPASFSLRKDSDSDSGCAGPSKDTVYDANKLLANRLLQWKFSDLGPSKTNHGNALGQQALPPTAISMVEEARRWKESEEWYKSRGIPWRRGWRFQGPPGTGQTSLVRALAEDLDLPIFVYDLATLFNNELQTAWQKMLASVPCIALIEDIDAVFDGRNNKAGGHLTFDCLLNCLDGVERADGVLLIVTTNNPERLDAALSGATGTDRPGRIDRVLDLGALDEAGREQLCQRILREWPKIHSDVIRNGAGETGAQFQERCTQIALNRYWSENA